MKKEKKVLFDQPLGKILMAIIAFYGFIITIIAFTYEKEVYFFLHNSTIVIVIDCFLLLFGLILANMKFLDEEQPSFLISFFERAALSILVIIVSFLFMSYMNNSFLSEVIENKVSTIVSFAIIQIIFGVSIIVSNFTFLLNNFSINFYRKKEHMVFITKIREWTSKKGNLLVILFSILHVVLTTTLYAVFIGTDVIRTIIDYIFFVEMVIQYIVLANAFAIVNYIFINKRKKSQANGKRNSDANEESSQNL